MTKESLRVAGLILFALTLSWTGLGAEKAPLLKVMTYNVRMDSRSDPMQWPDRRHLVAELIKRTSPDVIGTQEGMYHQLKDLQAGLPDYEWIGLGREGGSKSEFMAVFYRKDRLEPVAYDHFWLSDTPEVMNSTSWGNRVKRMVTWVQFKDLKNGRLFYLMNTHFDHQVQVARERSAELVRARIAQLDASLPLLLTGDFNCTLENPAYKTLTADGFLKDTWFDAAQRKGEGLATFNGFKQIQHNNARIDWILYRGNIAVDLAEIITWTKDGNFPSDHLPVMAHVRIE